MTYRVIQVCAWRIKYLISLPAPLDSKHWQYLAMQWAAASLDVLPLSSGAILYKLRLPEQLGILTGSSVSKDIYAILLRPEAETLLEEIISALRNLTEKIE